MNIFTQDQLNKIRTLYEDGRKDEASHLAYQWVKTDKWNRRDFQDFLTLWETLTSNPIPSDDPEEA